MCFPQLRGSSSRLVTPTQKSPGASSPNPTSGQPGRQGCGPSSRSGVSGRGALASSKSGYRLHRPGARAGEGASAGGHEARSPRLVAQDGGQSELVSISLHPGSEISRVGSCVPAWTPAVHLPSLLAAPVVAPAPGCKCDLWSRRAVVRRDTWRSGSGLAEGGELGALCCGLHQRLAQGRAG